MKPVAQIPRGRRLRAFAGLGLGLGLIAGAALAEGARNDSSRDGAWRHSSLWDDGNAEYCAYRVDWARYGTTYPGRALLILVKEPWAPELDVKADRPRPDGFDVLKLNHIRDVPTGIYSYHQMASVYLRRDDGAIEKVASTSSEACGITTALVRDGRLEVHSYFDGVPDRSLEVADDVLPEDGLPALLRDYLEGGPATLRVLPTLLDGRLADLSPVTYRVSRRPAGTVQVPAGSFRAIELRLEPEDEPQGDAGRGGKTYVFEAATPHRLLELEDDGGTRYRLAKCGRIPYWSMSQPGGEEWLPEEVRE